MKNTEQFILLAFVAFLALSFASCSDVTLEMSIPDGGTLEDAVLVVSDDGDAPREAYVLGDIDLSETSLDFPYDVNASTYTHWWLIGSMDGEVVYSSVADLTDVDMYSVDPYDGVTPLDWNIPANLDAYCNGLTYSFDWWAQTVNNHSGHVQANTGSASLWRFNNGSLLGTVTVSY